MARCRHAHPISATARPALLSWLAAEPFRVFFPWAACAGVWGVLLWPLFYAKWSYVYPALPHARLMAFGFGGAAVMGFLGTAVPRMLGAPKLQPWEAGALFVLHVSATAACATAHDTLGCSLFALTLAVLILLVGSRFWRRTDMPPPAFVLVQMGLLSGLAGALMFALHLDLQTPFLFRFTRLLANEAFLLLPILGVGGFLIARILGLRSRQSLPDSRTPPAGWWPLAIEALITGALLLGTFALEAAGWVRFAALLRFVLLIAWWSRDTPGLWRAKTAGTQAWMLKTGIVFVALAPLMLALDPLRMIAMEHVLFITGFGLTIYAVASRVAFGHSGHLEQSKAVSKPLRWVVWLAVLAMTTRVSADYLFSIQISHYVYAALTWTIITAIWLRLVWAKLWTPDPDA
jgi:uncharacterized protein involved in response to NO